VYNHFLEWRSHWKRPFDVVSTLQRSLQLFTVLALLAILLLPLFHLSPPPPPQPWAEKLHFSAFQGQRALR